MSELRDGEYHIPVAVTFVEGKVAKVEASGEGSPWMYSADPGYESAWMPVWDRSIPTDDVWATPTFEEHQRTDEVIARISVLTDVIFN